MERMRNKDLENAWAVQGIRQEKCAKLEEENKNLKEEVKKWKIVADENGTHYDMLEEENKNLREENDRLKNNAMEDMRVQTKLEDRIKELEQCNLNLQTWLDNKEKVNKSLREENEVLKEYKSMYEGLIVN